MRGLEAILGPSSSESCWLGCLQDSKSFPGLGQGEEGSAGFLWAGEGDDLGSMDFLFPRGNPGPPCPELSLGQPSLRQLPSWPVGEGRTSNNGPLSPALPPQPKSHTHPPDEETVA